MRKKSNGIARVSDHAVIRYLERVKGFDFEPIRNKIQKVAQASLDLGASAITVDGVQFVLNEHNLVVSTIDRRPGYMRGKVKQTVVAAE